MPIRERALPAIRREAPTNYGATQDIEDGRRRKELFTMSQEESENFGIVLEGNVTLELGPDETALFDYRPACRITWGHGGAKVSTDVDVVRRRTFPVTASRVEVECFVWACPLPGANTPIPGGGVLPQAQGTQAGEVSAKFRGFVGRGLALSKLATFWLTQFGVGAGCFVSGDCRANSVHGFVTNATPGTTYYLVLTDDAVAPTGGELAYDALPMVGGNNASFFLGESVAMQRGLSWAVSSTPDTVTLVPNLQAFVRTEILS